MGSRRIRGSEAVCFSASAAFRFSASLKFSSSYIGRHIRARDTGHTGVYMCRCIRRGDVTGAPPCVYIYHMYARHRGHTHARARHSRAKATREAATCAPAAQRRSSSRVESTPPPCARCCRFRRSHAVQGATAHDSIPNDPHSPIHVHVRPMSAKRMQ